MSIPPSYQLIDSVDALQNALQRIVDAQTALANANGSLRIPLLYVDLEGNDLCRDGTVSLIQLHLPSIQETFVIDVTVLGSAAFSASIPSSLPDSSDQTALSDSSSPSLEGPISLKTILESPEVIKCFFDVRNDADALYNIYGISMKSIVDIQILEIATRRGPRRLLNGLARAIRNDGELEPETLNNWLEVKTRGKTLFNSVPSTVAPDRQGSSPQLSTASPSQTSLSATSKPESNFAVFDVRPLPQDLLEYSINVSTRSICLELQL